ncbi:MAG TPA: MerR family transcriptional regulator [Treponema sp.]|nr:MerR family transcriptional regulator [Treponema sp.]
MTIAEVSRKYDISIDTLRYYERIGLLPPVTRDKSGFRDFTEVDCNWVEFIKCMRNANISIEALTEYVTLFQEGESTHDARKVLLEEQLAALDKRIAEMQAGRERLAWKVAHYEDKMKETEKNLL